MKIVFIGNIYFSYILLKAIFLFNSKVIKGVVTNNNKEKSDYFDLKKFCKKKKIEYIISNNINSKISEQWIKKKKPDLICCFGWSDLIKKRILDIAKIGSLGYHPTNLPYNRGRHPIIWTLVLGIKSTYSSFFFMNEKADFGHIIDQKKVKINNQDNSWKVYKKLSKIASKQLIKVLNHIQDKPNFYGRKRKSSVLKNKYNFWRKRDINDGKIDWRMSSSSIFNLVRALDKPFPGSFFTFRNRVYKVWKIKVKNNNNKINFEPGKVINLVNKKPEIKCGEGSIILKNVSPNLNIKIGDYL